MSEQAPRQAGCRDVIGPNLSLLFVGFNPGVASGETGYHFAGRNNRFWDLLFDVGLTDSRLTFAEDRRLLPLGYGITNIVARPTPGSGDLATAELRAGAVSLTQKLVDRQPRIACYLGKGIYAALRRMPSSQIVYGLQPASTVAGTLDFVAPSPSGRATIPYATKRAVMGELAVLVREDEAAVGLAARAAFAATLLQDSGLRAGDDLLVIDARVKADACTVTATGPSVVVCDADGEVLLARVAKQDLAKLPSDSLDAFLAAAKANLPAGTEKLATWNYTWDLILANPEQITRDFVAIGRRGIEGTIEEPAGFRGNRNDIFVAPGVVVLPVLAAVLGHPLGPELPGEPLRQRRLNCSEFRVA